MFACESCHFVCAKRGDWSRHLQTKKHLKPALRCACGQVFQQRAACVAHQQQCGYDKNALILQMLDENKELRALLLEQQEQLKVQQRQMSELAPKINVTNKFNLNVFLNEKCKDAINWDEFMSTLSVQIEGENSLTTGLAKIICDGIQDLGIHKRPIHCLDSRRKKLCIKNEDAWEHDSDKIQTTLHQSAITLQSKYIKELKEWELLHPNWLENEAETEAFTALAQRVTDEIDEPYYTACILRSASIPKED